MARQNPPAERPLPPCSTNSKTWRSSSPEPAAGAASNPSPPMDPTTSIRTMPAISVSRVNTLHARCLPADVPQPDVDLTQHRRLRRAGGHPRRSGEGDRRGRHGGQHRGRSSDHPEHRSGPSCLRSGSRSRGMFASEPARHREAAGRHGPVADRHRSALGGDGLSDGRGPSCQTRPVSRHAAGLEHARYATGNPVRMGTGLDPRRARPSHDGR